MADVSLKNKVVSSFFWKFLEKGGASLLGIVITIVLARLLLPEDYAVIAVILVFISFAEIFINSGFSTSLIQNKDVSEIDYSSVFYVTLAIALVFYVILFVSAPFIAVFYEMPILTDVMRVSGIILFFGAINSIQKAIISREFLFKKLFVSTLTALIISGTIGIILAFLNFGVWALVAQQLSSVITLCIVMLITVKWRPKWIFSIQRVKTLFAFGWKMLVSGFIAAISQNLTTLLIGKLYPANMLGFFTKGKEYPTYINSAIDSTIQEVMLPTFSKVQDDIYAAKVTLHYALVTSTFIIFPVMAGFAAVATPFVEFFLTDKWLPAVPFLQLFCLLFATYPLQSNNHRAIVGLGKSGIYLKLQIISVCTGIALVLGAMPFGVYSLTIAMVITNFIAVFIYSYPNKRLLHYPLHEQLKDVAPAIFVSLLMAGVVYAITFTGLPSWLCLLIQIPLGIVIYIGLAKLLKLKAFTFVVTTLKNYLHKK